MGRCVSIIHGGFITLSAFGKDAFSKYIFSEYPFGDYAFGRYPFSKYAFSEYALLMADIIEKVLLTNLS